MLITAFILFVNRLRTASFHDRKRPNFERLQIMLSATQKFTFDKGKRLTQKKKGISFPGWGIVIPQIPFAYSVLSPWFHCTREIPFYILFSQKKCKTRPYNEGAPAFVSRGIWVAKQTASQNKTRPKFTSIEKWIPRAPINLTSHSFSHKFALHVKEFGILPDVFKPFLVDV